VAKWSEPKAKFLVHEGTRQQLLELDTAPFRELLALMLSAFPDMDALKHWAARHPDRMAQSIMNIARCAGIFGKEAPAPINIVQNFHGMSDSQFNALLMQQYQELSARGLLPSLPAERLDTILEQQPEGIRVVNE
jgi:hypothetical protein